MWYIITVKQSVGKYPHYSCIHSASKGVARFLKQKALKTTAVSVFMKTFRTVWNIITGTLVAIVIIVALALVGVRLLGWQVFSVISGSMEPTYHVGSIIYVKQVDYREIKIGDPITYTINDDTVVTHRVVDIVRGYYEDETVVDENGNEVKQTYMVEVPEGSADMINGEEVHYRFQVQGDANDHPDGTLERDEEGNIVTMSGLVWHKNVIGVPVFTIPYLGYVSDFIQNNVYLAVSGGAILILLVFIPDLLGMDDKKKTAPEAVPAGEATSAPPADDDVKTELIVEEASADVDEEKKTEE